MKERGILFSGPMVRAILEGRKTETRRIIKAKYIPSNPRFGYTMFTPEGHISVRGDGPDGYGEWFIKCPYIPGDRLWVRETWWHEVMLDNENAAFSDGFMKSRRDVGTGTEFNIPGWEPKPPHWRKRPSIFMPRWASRITLEIVSVRAERLQDITEAGAEAEGVYCLDPESDQSRCWVPGFHNTDKVVFHCAQNAYFDLWESINGTGSWDANPYVWVVEFKAVAP